MPKISIAQHREDVARFTKEREKYELYAEVLEEVLKRAAVLYDPLAIVSARAKSVASFAGKIVRKDKYADPLRDMTDLCGARIITHFQSQEDNVCAFIQANFDIDEANSVNAAERLGEDAFGLCLPKTPSALQHLNLRSFSETLCSRDYITHAPGSEKKVMIQRGVPPENSVRVVAEFLGHSDIRTMAKFYQAVRHETIKQTARNLRTGTGD